VCKYAYAVPKQKDMSLGEAALAIGVSTDTLRRWDRDGKLRSHRDARNRRRVSAAEVARLSKGHQRHRTRSRGSARNRMAGVVRSVEIGGVMALVEIEAGPYMLTAAVTRDSVRELALAEGVHVSAVVKATSLMVERDDR
jgi:molybdopterin-binding protein